MNISLPDQLKNWVESQVTERGYGTGSEYLRELIRRDQDVQAMRSLLLEGAQSPRGPIADVSYFDQLRGLADGNAGVGQGAPTAP